jgi:predicted PurR-regulated permease PerM
MGGHPVNLFDRRHRKAGRGDVAGVQPEAVVEAEAEAIAAALRPPAAAPGGSAVRQAVPTVAVFRIALTATLGVAVAYLLVKTVVGVRDVLVLLVLAFVFALGLEPLVRALVRRGWRRLWAVTTVATGVALVVAGFLAAILPPIITQGTALVDNAPTYIRDLQSQDTAVGRLLGKYNVLDTLHNQFSSVAREAVSGALGIGGVVLGATASTLTVIVLTVYFLANMPAVKSSAWRMIPASRRQRVAELGDRIFDQVGGYILGNVITSVVAGAGTFVFLAIVHVPYPLALGIFVALFDLIPVVGSSIAGLVVTLVALTVSVPVAIASLIFYIAYRMFEDYLLNPRIMERTVSVPPFLTIVALLLGGALLGITGAFLAIPVAAALQLILVEVAWPKLDES